MHQDELFLKKFQEPPNPTHCTFKNMAKISVENYSDDDLSKRYMNLLDREAWNEGCKNCKMPSLLHNGPCTRQQEANAFESNKILEERDKFYSRMRNIAKDVAEQERRKDTGTGHNDLLKR